MNAARYNYPEAIASTQWLAEHLHDADLRLFDCTMYLVSPTPNDPYEVENAQADHDAGHIPGAAYIDLQSDLSKAASDFRFTMPPPDEAARRFAAMGIGNNTRVVLYSRGTAQWATRVWWMLRAVGFDNVALLDGGWEKWQAEARPTSTDPVRYPSASSLDVHPRPGLFVGRDEIRAAIDLPGAVVINALSAELHAGHSGRYGRPGRIPNSVNVPTASLRNPHTLELVSAEQAARAFAAVGVKPDSRVVIYCGGGIAATMDAFVLHQLGHTDITVYDNSLNEWAKDPTLPLESDPVA